MFLVRVFRAGTSCLLHLHIVYLLISRRIHLKCSYHQLGARVCRLFHKFGIYVIHALLYLQNATERLLRCLYSLTVCTDLTCSQTQTTQRRTRTQCKLSLYPDLQDPPPIIAQKLFLKQCNYPSIINLTLEIERDI